MNDKTIGVFFLSYDGYNNEGELMRQGFITMDREQKNINNLLIELNKKAVKENMKINFYREYKKVLEESFNYHQKNFSLEKRLSILF